MSSQRPLFFEDISDFVCWTNLAHRTTPSNACRGFLRQKGLVQKLVLEQFIRDFYRPCWLPGRFRQEGSLFHIHTFQDIAETILLNEPYIGVN